MNIKTTNRPFSQAVAVTPDDDTDLVNAARALYISVAGTLRVTMGGAVVNFPVVTPGVLPVSVTRVHDTGTDATGILALN